MKNYKRSLAIITAAFLAAAPIAVTGMTAIAAATTGTSTLSITDSDSAEHTYKAYQIITGTQEAGKLKELSWGSAIPAASRAAFIGELNTLLGLTGDDALAGNAKVQTVAEALSTINGDADKSVALAKIVQKHVSDSEAITMTQSGDTYSAGSLADGWYLVLDKSDPLVDGDTDGVKVRSANVLKLIGDTNINAKHSLPTLEKKIVEGSQEVDSNAAAIGDVVTYKIKTTVPNVIGYDKYFYVVEDTLSSGLTYNEGSLGVTVSGTAVTEDTDGVGETVTTGDFYVTHDNGEIKVVFKNAATYFKNKTVGDDIIITYTATLNSNAVITDDGNPNTASLVYSNDPNETGEGTNEPGKPDEPSDDSPTGETPKDEVITYTTAIKLYKVDQKGDPLTGAEFTLTGNNLKNVKVASGTSFEADASGDYWLLNDGSYTKVDPSTLSETEQAKYSDTSTKYKKVAGTTAFTEVASSEGIVATVDANGIITFTGLKPGVYTLHESKVPDGYNAAGDVEITITANDPVSGPSNWTYENATYNDTNAVAEVEIENRQGATLPSTGGIGTKLFYIFGSLLVVGSGVLLITKKRMNTKEN
ncbi:isopeptide-forming domain-containing fimbrial protein [Ruminococcus flavefaciens]|uniref:isopeptide-forming domain-containing fimbrial protein n=1 Tax=Ruminococcus flavefaciens TaxID=1265 RepID=UPI0002DB54A0|nr:isopeptide-forming domain-containing fimbrial protein [Ruminococcus flavefaciens]